MVDEFDAYFTRAQLEGEQLEKLQNRRCSLPAASPTPESKSSLNRRVGSCKYPRRRGSNSPRDHSTSPRRSITDGCPDGVSPAYINEPTLRAPSPRLGTKCHSAPHSRSSSWKKMRRPRSSRDVTDDLDYFNGRDRSGSTPNDDDTVMATLEKLRIAQQEDLCVVRTFEISSKGLVNRGDSFKRRSDASIASSCNSSGAAPSCADETPLLNKPANSTNSTDNKNTAAIFRVAVIGASGVGKTSLLQQFMTSEYMGGVEISFDDESERTVSVLLDGEDTTMTFNEIEPQAASVQNYKTTDIDAFIFIYSITDKKTIEFVEERLHDVQRYVSKPHAAIVVGNKSDLVRKRQVKEDDARQLCSELHAKYIEVSAALNHRVDDLLVGIARQIRFNPQRAPRKITDKSSTKAFLKKILGRTHCVSRTCDDLMVL